MNVISKDNINEAKLYIYHALADESLKELWEEYDQKEVDYDGLEIPTSLNWHNGKEYGNIENYYKINLIAVWKWEGQYRTLYSYGPTMTDLKHGKYRSIKKKIGQTLYSINEVKSDEIYLFDERDCVPLKAMKCNSGGRFSKYLKQPYIIGVRIIQYDKFPYSKYIDVMGPKETFFLEND